MGKKIAPYSADLKRKKKSRTNTNQRMLSFLEDEEKYKQTSSVSIRHGIGDTMIDGLNRRSTVAEVLQKLTKQLDLDRQTEWVIIEKWRGTEKELPMRTRLLRVWHAWCSEQSNVEFWLAKSKSKFTQRRFESGRRKKKKEPDDWCDTDSMDSDSSDSGFVDSLATSDSDLESLKGDNVERQQLIRLLESQAAQIKNNKQKAERLEDEMD